MIKRRLFFGALIAATLLTSCKDDISVDEKIDNKLVEKKLSEKEAKLAIEDSKQQLDMFLLSTKLLKKNFKKTDAGCKLNKFVTIEDGKIKFTFNPKCDFNGKKYEGSITVEYKSNGLIGYTRTLNYDSFVKDGIKLSGKVSFDVVLLNKEKHLYASSTYDLSTTLPDGTKYTKKGSHKIERVEGGKTPLRIKDDVYETSGEWISNGITGPSQIKITKNIVNKTNCLKGAVSGTMEISKGKEKSVIDFGNGDCERKTTIDGKEFKF